MIESIILSATGTLALLLEEDSSGVFYVGAALFLAGPLFFTITYARYRNRGERHYYERETPVRMDNLQTYDNLEQRLTRQESPLIVGANNKRVDGSLVKGGSLESVTDTLGSMLPGGTGDLLKKLK
jgi:hypothetical protein